jgi:hypothetical protein
MKVLPIKLLASVALILFLYVNSGYGQDQLVNDKIENVLKQFKNYRFGNIYVLEIKNISELRRALKTKTETKTAVKKGDECVKAADPRIAKIVENGAKAGDDISIIMTDISNQGLALPSKTDLDCIYNFYVGGIGGEEPQIERAYLVTTRPASKIDLGTIIGLIVSFEDSDNLKKNLKNVTFSNIYSYRELKLEPLDESFKARTLYDLMYISLQQGNYENRTLEAQGIGTDIFFAPKVYGITSSMIYKESEISEYDIEQFMRVSDGQASNYFARTNEIIVSPDLLSWKNYEMPYKMDASGNPRVDSLGKKEIDSTWASNYSLPKFGLELKYGIDDINYPSYWSERLTASALWQNVKLGVILPVGMIGNDATIFSQERKLTNGGFGIAGSFDFPVRIIPQSGIFHFDFGYVFGDAVQSKYKSWDNDPNTYIVVNTAMNDFLVRANAQLHYTFGLRIDENYMLRFGLLGSVYNIERWYNNITYDVNQNAHVTYAKLKDETIGGLSGKMEFMAMNIVTPFGASIQYFDEAIGTDAWLQLPLPILDNRMALRLEAKGYFTAFREPRDWETSSIFIPMARLIVNF